ncbi:MAG: 50S ribosomal protein L22 [Bacteroidales bacterium]|jgi:large subunit ribosomal protein L22|nr:50S ribosomal protein L22 [Bacteroidales bacterium]
MKKSKKDALNERKEAKKTVYMARLVDNPTSPRKTRIMANVIRGKNVDYAMNVLKYSHRESAEKLLKLLKSAVANWQVKNEGARLENADLYVKTIMVDGGRMLKRIRTAPQGRANRIRKRSNHVTLIIADRNAENINTEITTEESQN